MDELIEKIDERFGRDGWDLWRSAMGHWCFKTKDRSATLVEIDNQKLGDLLKEAAEIVPIPKIPRRPEPSPVFRFSTAKSGSKWSIYFDGRFVAGSFRTKDEACRAIESISKRTDEAIKSWGEKYGQIVASGIEGVNFIYRQ